MSNSTISGNTANAEGGGIHTTVATTLVYATVVDNTAPTGSNVHGLAGSSLTSLGPGYRRLDQIDDLIIRA